MTRLRKALLTLLALTLVRLPMERLLAVLLPDASVAPEVNALVSIMQSLVLFALPGWLLMQERERSAPEWSWLSIAIVSAVFARVAITPLNEGWSRLLGETGTLLPPASGFAQCLVRVLALAFVPALAEELFFRGALLGNLRTSCGNGAAILLVTLMFTLMHGSIAGLPGHLVISLLLTLLMMHSTCIYVPIAAHLTYNLTALFLPEQALPVTWLCGGVLAALLLLLVLRLPTGAGMRMARKDRLLCGASLAVMAAQYFV